MENGQHLGVDERQSGIRGQQRKNVHENGPHFDAKRINACGGDNFVLVMKRQKVKLRWVVKKVLLHIHVQVVCWR